MYRSTNTGIKKAAKPSGRNDEREVSSQDEGDQSDMPNEWEQREQVDITSRLMDSEPVRRSPRHSARKVDYSDSPRRRRVQLPP